MTVTALDLNQQQQLEVPQSTFNLLRRDDGIAVLTIDVPGESINSLRDEFIPEVNLMLDDIAADSRITGLVMISGKPDSFIAGADISMLDRCDTVADAKVLSQQCHQVFARLQGLGIPVVAAIHGACLGGGLELALACDQRICSDDSKTLLGLPEVQLGLLPGGGGTQRLPRLIGVMSALDMMLTGKQVRAKAAKKMGLVDDIVPKSILLQSAVAMAKRGISPRPGHPLKQPLSAKLLEATAMGRNIIYQRAAAQVMAQTQGNYPAPEKIIDCVRQGMNSGMEQGLALETEYFASLVMTPESRAMRAVFFAMNEMKKETGAGEVQPNAVRKAVVLGGGLMGGGIASVTSTKAKVPVRVKDINETGLSHALAYAYRLLDKKVRRRHMRAAERDSLMALMTTTTEYQGVKDADIVVEAVFEDLALKHQMVRDIERECHSETIFASNTSSLPITQIAQAASRPENVIGLHYFSPVDKMPLVEVIAHQHTSPQTIATTVAFARKQGKTPIVVQDCAGFYVNRILALYMNEAAQWLLEGLSVESLDRALVKFGFPVGPITLLDEVGIDVGAKIAPILEQELGSRFAAPKAFDALLADDRRGRKNSKGFYLYGKGAPKKGKKVDESVYRVLGIMPRDSVDESLIARRCMVQMLNEAARCLEEGIIASPRDGDIGALFGIGFPPFRGGPFRYMDSLGAKALVEELEQYRQTLGERFAPCELLQQMAADSTRFYS